MTAVATPLTGASPACAIGWDDLAWSTCKRQVQRLQMRIAKATREGKKGKVKALQRLLTRSFYAKCLAVKRVVQNKGAKTPGVDGIVWRTPLQKMSAVLSLKPHRYKPKPLKRIYIPKKDGSRKRPLSIPSMACRAMQALWLLALEPIAEERADPNSYGFRPKRCAADAIEQCHIALSKRDSAPYILNGDITSCFDKISHSWLLENIPMDKKILRKFLGAGFMEKGQIYPTTDGTPQGSPISPTLTVMTLSGLEAELNQRFKRGTKVNYVSYADDFIITGASRELLEARVIPVVKDFLAQRGLELSDKKTTITHVTEGFDFLGHHLRKYKDRFLTKPAKPSIKALLKDVRATMKALRGKETAMLIHTLNPKIRGWCQYFRHASSAKAFSYIDYQIYGAVDHWIHRRHTSKSAQWRKKKYFMTQGARNWVFHAKVKEKGQQTKVYTLMRAESIHIKRHIKIKGAAHPYNPQFKEYFEQREEGRRTKRWAV